MITENGIVTTATSSTAWIKTIRSGACESCSSKKSCGTAGNQKEMIVTVKNTLRVEPGDHVVIGLETGPIMFLTFLLYVFPILMLIAGALIGNHLGSIFSFNASTGSMIVGFAFFSIAFGIIKFKNRSFSKDKAFKPFLIRKKPQAVVANCSLS